MPDKTAIVPAEAPQEVDAIYVPEEAPKKRANWKLRILSLLLAALLFAALVGGLYLYQTVEQGAFAPIETAYAGFSARSAEDFAPALYPALYGALADEGTFRIGGEWHERITTWQGVYGHSFTAAPELDKMHLVRGEEKDAFLRALETRYGLTPDIPLLIRLDYTVTVTAEGADAELHKSAYTGLVDGRWYLLQADF